MRAPCMIVMAALAVGQARAEEPSMVSPLPEPPSSTADAAPVSSGFLRRLSWPRSNRTTWRPFSRWFSGTGSSEEAAPIDAGNSPEQSAASIDLGEPPAGIVNAAGSGAAATASGAGNPTAPPGTEASTSASRGSEPVSGNPAAVDIVAGTGALGRLLGIDPDSGIRLGGLWIGDASGVLSGGRARVLGTQQPHDPRPEPQYRKALRLDGRFLRHPVLAVHGPG